MVSELTKQINKNNLTKDEKISFLNFLCGWMDKDNNKSYMIEMLKAYKSFHKDLLNTKYGKYAELRTTQLPNRLKINQNHSFTDLNTNKLIFGIVIEINTKKGIMKIKDSKGNIHHLIY